MVQGSGFRASGFRVQISGFRVQGLGLEALVIGDWNKGLGFGGVRSGEYERERSWRSRYTRSGSSRADTSF